MRTLKRSMLVLTSGMIFGLSLGRLGCLGETITREFEVLFALDSLDTGVLVRDSFLFDWFGQVLVRVFN